MDSIFPSSAKKSAKLKVVTVGNRSYIDVHPDKGMALSRYLRSHGVTCSPPQPSSKDVDSIELDRGADVKGIKLLLDEWV